MSIFSERNPTQENDLREAAKNGELNKVKTLLKTTFVDGKDEEGCTALAWAGEYFKSNERKLASCVLVWFEIYCLFQLAMGIPV